MISNMDLRNSRKELRKLSKELKEKQGRVSQEKTYQGSSEER